MKADENRSAPVAHVREALEKGAVVLYAQPIGAIDVSLTYPMAEVLLRVHEVERSNLPPGAFFRVPEHYGVLPQLDRWVLRRALERLAAGCRIPRLCINLSRQTLADPGFPAFFAEALETAGVPGERVLFDVNESDAAALPGCMARFAAIIGSLGTGIVLESFGGAPDAWTPLQVPSVRFVKLHGALTRRLVLHAHVDGDTVALVEAVKRLGIELIADLVEDTRVLRRLQALGIRHAQGFAIYQPQPLDSFGQAAVQLAWAP